MLLASYIGIRPGLQGLGNISIRLRLSTKHTHSEVVFEPSDGVDYLMPDGTCAPNEKGEYWCASSVFSERLPNFSPHRANKLGGVRFKRINPNSPNWELTPIEFVSPEQVARWFVLNQGRKYDYQLILKYVIWIVRFTGPSRVMCSESIAAAVGYQDPDRIDPHTLVDLIKFANMIFKKFHHENNISDLHPVFTNSMFDGIK